MANNVALYRYFLRSGDFLLNIFSFINPKKLQSNNENKEEIFFQIFFVKIKQKNTLALKAQTWHKNISRCGVCTIIKTLA